VQVFICSLLAGWVVGADDGYEGNLSILLFENPYSTKMAVTVQKQGKQYQTRLVFVAAAVYCAQTMALLTLITVTAI